MNGLMAVDGGVRRRTWVRNSTAALTTTVALASVALQSVQDAARFPWLTVRGNVELAVRLRGVSRKERRSQAEALSYVPINVLARYGMTRRRMAELIEVLSGNLEKSDRKADAEQED